MIIYAFDVDDTLEISNGPVTLKSMMDLRVQGHIVGLCGNWGLFVSTVPGWQHLISFHNFNGTKIEYLTSLKQLARADDYVMVGNVGPICSQMYNVPITGGSNDMSQSFASGWRFIKEHDFAKGNR